MRVHYFYKRNSGPYFYDVKMEALWEQDVYSSVRKCKEKSFTYVERIKAFISKDQERSQFKQFDIEFGKNSACGLDVKSVAELNKSMKRESYCGSWQRVTRKQYERIRKVLFALYQKGDTQMNFDLFKGKQTYSITRIIG
ncbi:MAG: hypothetical protein AB2L24_21780 [Mangrovibacterium sp.]